MWFDHLGYAAKFFLAAKNFKYLEAFEREMNPVKFLVKEQNILFISNEGADSIPIGIYDTIIFDFVASSSIINTIKTALSGFMALASKVIFNHCLIKFDELAEFKNSFFDKHVEIKNCFCYGLFESFLSMVEKTTGFIFIPLYPLTFHNWEEKLYKWGKGKKFSRCHIGGLTPNTNTIFIMAFLKETTAYSTINMHPNFYLEHEENFLVKFETTKAFMHSKTQYICLNY